MNENYVCGSVLSNIPLTYTFPLSGKFSVFENLSKSSLSP